MRFIECRGAGTILTLRGRTFYALAEFLFIEILAGDVGLQYQLSVTF